VIVGRADTSQIFNKLSNALPIQFTGAEIAFDGHSAGGDVGVAMVFPNPLNPEKYIALVLSDSDLVLKNMPNIWNTEIANADVDAAIFKVKPNNQYDLIRFEKFNTVWDWHTHWNETLATVSREHPKWQWRQWFAYVVRCQMESDVMISEEVIEVPTFLKSETLTLRHLNRFLKDQWHVKIKLNGRELKKVLMQSFPRAGGLNKNKTDEPVVDGICFIKSMAGPDCLHVSDIKEEKYYTVAMPYKAVNGSRIGTILKDYEIVGDGYLLPMLYQYLKSRESVDLDTELDEMKLTII
jgi:hypothetical protein